MNNLKTEIRFVSNNFSQLSDVKESNLTLSFILKSPIFCSLKFGYNKID